MSLKKKIFLKSFLAISLFSISLQAFATWVPPSGIPPLGNTEPPINTSSTTQAKDGGIVAWSGLRSGTVLVVDGTSDLKGNVTIFPGKTLTLNTETYTFPANQTANGYLKTDGAGNLTWDVSSGGVSDGDKGDITVSGSGATWTIDPLAVTYSKIQNVGANRFLANLGNSAGPVQEINTNRIPLFSSAITGTPGVTNYLRGDGSWQVLNSLTDGDKGDITVSSSGSVWNIDAGVVGNTELAADSITSDKIAVDGVSKTDIAAVFGGANKVLGLDDTGLSLEYKGLIAGSGITITHDVNNSNITFTANGGITDGDKGDITVSGTGTVWTVDALSITNGKIAALAVDDPKIAVNAVSNTKILNGAVTVSKVSISGTATDEFCLTYETTGATFEWQTCGGADNLGNHTATQALQMAGFTINGNSTANGDLILDSTSNGSLKGDVVINPVNGSVGVGQPVGTTFVSKFEVAGAVATTLGTASAPTRTFLGDTNTGTFSPGADIFAITTSGVERMRVDTSGNISISSVIVGKGTNQLGTNLAVGINALGGNNSGLANNTAVGYQVLQSNTTGDANSGFGQWALRDNTVGYRNTAVGSTALAVNTGGFENSAFGYQALLNNLDGDRNSAFGKGALQLNTAGNNNSAFGNGSLNATTGSNNTAFGYFSLLTNTTGTNNTAIGYSADVSTGGLTNATAIGNGAIVSASNSMVFGNTAITQNTFNGGVIVNNNNSAKPSCTASVRGMFFVVQGATGVKDNVEVCAKDAANTYAWRTLY